MDSENPRLAEFVEKGAEIEHTRWAKWQSYIHSKLVPEERFENGKHFLTGNFILSKELVERWERQIRTEYKDLTEQEKESDRVEARSYLPLIQELINPPAN